MKKIKSNFLRKSTKTHETYCQADATCENCQHVARKLVPSYCFAIALLLWLLISMPRLRCYERRRSLRRTLRNK